MAAFTVVYIQLTASQVGAKYLQMDLIVMSESLGELKAIRDGAPRGTTIVDVDDDGDVSYMYHNEDCPAGQRILDSKNGEDAAIEFSDGNIRSLSDIERIIELMELNQNMHTTVAGYIYGKDWEHWNEFNRGKFKL